MGDVETHTVERFDYHCLVDGTNDRCGHSTCAERAYDRLRARWERDLHWMGQANEYRAALERIGRQALHAIGVEPKL